MNWRRPWRTKYAPGVVERQPRTGEPYGVNVTTEGQQIDWPAVEFPVTYEYELARHWQDYQHGKISFAQYKALDRLFSPLNHRMSKAQVEDEYRRILAQTDG